MIEETYKSDGSYRSIMVCDNPRCRRPLAEWEDPADEPSFEQRKYWLFEAVLRIRLVDRRRQPVQALVDLKQLNTAVFFPNVKGGGVGYRIKTGSHPLLADFCSDECAQQLVTGNKKLNLCVRHEASRIQFVADEPRGFRTQELILDI